MLGFYADLVHHIIFVSIDVALHAKSIHKLVVAAKVERRPAVAESCEAAEGVQGNRKMIIGTGVGLV